MKKPKKPGAHARRRAPRIAQAEPAAENIAPAAAIASSPEQDDPERPAPARLAETSRHVGEWRFAYAATPTQLVASRPVASTRRMPGSRAAVDHSVRHELSKLVQRVFLPVGGLGASRSVMFTTTAPNREAETACATTAEILTAHTARSVCLVDANLREPSLHRRFGVQNQAGLSDLVRGAGLHSAVAVKLAPKFWLVPAGPRLNGPRPSLDELNRSVARLLATFDFVLFSAAALGAQSDALALAPALDGVVLLVDAETRRDTARQAVDSLQTVHARLLGIMLTSGAPAVAHAVGA